MKIYNSLTGKLEEFRPINEGKVTMYVCGPTVYNYVHIGNMRPVITFDMVYKYFKYLGYDIKYASNFTDVNPKIIQAAEELKITEREVAERFIQAYMDDLANYNCGNIDYRPRVINNMQNICNFIQALIDKDYAYVNDGDVYFRVNRVSDYGILSNQNREELKMGARVEIDEKKEDPLDFALWRKTDHGEQFDSPWGKGIPGWHTECVVMINSLFGEKIDIHGGGIDLKFPHHENEVAQSMALSGNHLANYWMHNGHINVNGEKMSKSLGNFTLARDFIKKYTPNVIKIALFKSHYRMPINFTDELFDEAKVIDEKIGNVLKQANLYMRMNGIEICDNIRDGVFEGYMDDDFNTPNVISYVLEIVKKLNGELRNKGNSIGELTSKLLIITDILGLKYEMKKFSKEDMECYNKWLECRSNRNFEEADRYRKLLMEKNIL